MKKKQCSNNSIVEFSEAIQNMHRMLEEASEEYAFNSESDEITTEKYERYMREIHENPHRRIRLYADEDESKSSYISPMGM